MDDTNKAGLTRAPQEPTTKSTLTEDAGNQAKDLQNRTITKTTHEGRLMWKWKKFSTKMATTISQK